LASKAKATTTIALASNDSLPKGWRTVRFGEVVRDVNEAERSPIDAGLERFVGLEHIEPENLHLKQWGLLADGDISFTKRFRKGQVLFGKRRAYQRKVAVAEFDGICSSDILTFEPKGEDLLPELLPFIVQSEGFLEHALGTSSGSLSPRTRWSQLQDYEFPLPPKDEQRRIADLLWAADECVEHWKLIHSQCDALRRLLLHRCMRGQESAGSKRATTLGDLPRSWNILAIAEAGEVQLGRQRSPAYQTGEFTRPYLRVANVFDGFLKLDDVLDMDFNARDYATFALKPGDILLNEGQSRELVGRCAIYNGEIDGCCFQNTLIRFRARSGVHPRYAFYFLQHLFYSGEFAAVARQTTSIAHLGAERFCKLEMAIPPPDEQERLVRVLDAIGQTVANASGHVTATENLKSWVGGQLLSGTRCKNVIH
jgi:type I restriction enzyme, S subunit